MNNQQRLESYSFFNHPLLVLGLFFVSIVVFLSVTIPYMKKIPEESMDAWIGIKWSVGEKKYTAKLIKVEFNGILLKDSATFKINEELIDVTEGSVVILNGAKIKIETIMPGKGYLRYSMVS